MPDTPPVEPQFTNVSQWADHLLANLPSTPLRPEERLLLDAQRAALATAATADSAVACEQRNRPTIIRDSQELAGLAEAIANEPAVAIDLETAGLDPREGEIVGVGFAAGEATFYVPVGHRFRETNGLLPDQLSLADLGAAIDLTALPLVAHNAKFEFRWLRHHLSVLPRFVWDTMLAARLLRSDLRAGLKEVAVRDLDVPDWSLPNSELAQIQFLPIDRVANYCCKDTQFTLDIYRRQKPCLN
jgi:DNA polymerase I-like protein with 3'-5' exonuclease and polymerase domains